MTPIIIAAAAIVIAVGALAYAIALGRDVDRLRDENDQQRGDIGKLSVAVSWVYDELGVDVDDDEPATGRHRQAPR